VNQPQSIQPIGFHVGLSDDWIVTAVSTNIGEFLACSATDLLGQPITALFSEGAIHDMRNRMALLRGDASTEHLFRFPLADEGRAFDLAIYRKGDGYGLDAEPSDEHGFGDSTGIVLGMLSQVEPADDVSLLCEQAARQLRALTGFERVTFCAGGKLLGQSARSPEDPFDPAAMAAVDDLAVVDRDAEEVSILSDGPHDVAGPRSTLRAPTKDEVRCFAALGARAALVLPLTRDGRLWGQVGCYHRSARHVSAERRNIARLFAHIMSLRIELAELRSKL
jgi:light-regulated signal transduction histidine kinase (bacteriophytochrome)